MDADLDFDFERVLPFVKQCLPGFARVEGARSIGLRQHGELVAGVIYEGINAHNLWMHVAARPGARWLTRRYLEVCFQYPFNVCGVDRVSGYVDASNIAARRFDEHLGFKEEARLKGAAQDGGDVILYVMRRSECRYV